MLSFPRSIWFALLFTAAIFVSIAAVDGPDMIEFSQREIDIIATHLATPIIEHDPTNRFSGNRAAAHLGQFLFFDERFSSTGTVSCATCHDPRQAFTDGLAVAKGVVELDRNSMSLLNVAANRWFFWDGRADTLWAQALHPFEDQREFASSRTAAAIRIAQDQALRDAYESVFGKLPAILTETGDRLDPTARPTAGSSPAQQAAHTAWKSMSDGERDAVNEVFVNIGKAIAAYESQLVSINSPFDRFAKSLAAGAVAGEVAADFPPQAQRGLKVFINRGNCRLCHMGPHFTDGEFHNNGIPARAGGVPTDPGRFRGVEHVLNLEFKASGPYSDQPAGTAADRARFLRRTTETWGQFKTPTLRNVAATGPYMHAGQMETLSDVLRFYNTLETQIKLGHHQETLLVPLELTSEELADLEAFLRSLSGSPIDESLLSQPQSPSMSETDKTVR